MKYLILGDVHGAFGNAGDVIRKALADHGPIDQIIQLGDMGFGFPSLRPWQSDYGIRQVWIDGNHDNHEMLARRSEPNFDSDPYHSSGWSTFLDLWEYKSRGSFENGFLFIGGASSIDKQYRTVGLDWWPGEDISYEDEEAVLATIERVGADAIHTVISHEAPEGFSMLEALQSVQGSRAREFNDANRKFLEFVRNKVQPDRWYFGHYHIPWSGQLDGCEWRCIDMVRGRVPVDKEDYVLLEIP